MNPSVNAFRFSAGNSYAVDILGESVFLLVERSSGWERVNELPDYSASNFAISAAGGPVKFVEAFIEALNAVLRILQGGAAPGDLPEPDGTPQGDVLAYLNSSVVAHTMMDGVVQLRVK